MHRRGLAGPSTDYIGVGKSATLAWLSGPSVSTVTVPPGARVLVDPALDAIHAGKNELVHGIFDFDVDRPVKLSVVSLPASADATMVTAGLNVLPNSGAHTRGTFPNAGVHLVVTSANDMRWVDVGGGDVEPNLDGTSFVDANAPAVLEGGFGVAYDVAWMPPTPQSIVVAARGGAWAAAASIAKGDDGDSTPLGLPSASTNLDAGDQAVFVGRFGAGASEDLTFMTAGGSSLPIAFVTVLP